jgi:hypothetical protein
MLTWLAQNKEWVFSGVGIAVISVAVWLVRKLISRSRVEALAVTQSPAISMSPSITQSPSITVSPTFNNSVVVPPNNSTFSHARYAEWQRLDTELRPCLRAMSTRFLPFNAYKPGDPHEDPDAAMQHAYDVLHGSLLIADVIEKSGLLEKWNTLVKYVYARELPREPNQRGIPTQFGFASQAEEFLQTLGRVAREDLGA